MYGPIVARNRAEYMNAALYVFATIMLAGGFAAQLSKEPKWGLVLLLIALALIIVVNIYDLVAHLAGIDYRLQLMGHDSQLALVEFAVAVVQAVGALLFFWGIFFLFIQGRTWVWLGIFGSLLFCWGINQRGESIQDAANRWNEAWEPARRSAREIGSRKRRPGSSPSR